MKNLTAQEKNDLNSFVFDALGQCQKVNFWESFLAKSKAFSLAFLAENSLL